MHPRPGLVAPLGILGQSLACAAASGCVGPSSTASTTWHVHKCDLNLVPSRPAEKQFHLQGT